MTRPALQRLGIAACLVALAWPLAGDAQSTPSAKDLAARIQAHYVRVNDFTADFTQTESSPLLPKGTTDRGTLKIKKPLRMRWTYADKREFVSDGVMSYWYEPRDKYVRRQALPKANEASTGLLFLAGRGDLTKDFVPTLPANQPAGEWRLVLRPAAGRQADFTTLTLEVARTSLELRGLGIADEEAGTVSQLRFSNFKQNRGLTDREFVFQVPKGVDVE